MQANNLSFLNNILDHMQKVFTYAMKKRDTCDVDKRCEAERENSIFSVWAGLKQKNLTTLPYLPTHLHFSAISIVQQKVKSHFSINLQLSLVSADVGHRTDVGIFYKYNLKHYN